MLPTVERGSRASLTEDMAGADEPYVSEAERCKAAEKAYRETVAAQISMVEAYASTSGGGHLFRFVANVLLHTCELVEKEAVARPPIEAAQAELAKSIAEMAAQQKELRKSKQAEAAAHEAWLVEEAKARIARANVEGA